MAGLEKLFTPCKIGQLLIPNRFIMTAITTRYDFEESDRLEKFYAERAKGGVGLITTGALQTLFPGRKTGYGRVNIHTDDDVPQLRKWVRAIHDNGGLAAAQLATYGYWSKKGKEGTAEQVGPSKVVFPREGLHPLYSLAEYLPPIRPLSLEEIAIIQSAIGDAALRAQEAGFDAVELQCIGGNLLHLFTNPFTNTRDDEYGGSIENRLRIIAESIRDIREKTGNDVPVICRIPGLDMVPWGLDLKEWEKMALMLEDAGVDALNIYPRWYESRAPLPQMCVPRNAFVYLAEAIRQVVKIPVITGIRITDPVDAERIIKTGKADFIGMARPLIADPYLPLKAKEGRLGDVNFCTACCRCYDDVVADKFMSCSVNAMAGREGDLKIEPAKDIKSVLIIGGGPAGMEAARVAAIRGHKVVLFEKKQHLGGQLAVAAVPPFKGEWQNTIRYLSTQLEKLHVNIRTNEQCTIKNIEEEKPDVLILATGAVPQEPKLPGVDSKNVSTAIDILTNARQTGNSVVIIGGGMTGCETAEFLRQQGKDVTILEMLPRIGHEYGPMNRWVVLDRLVAAGIRLETGVKVQEITTKGVKAIRMNLYPEFFEADSVVLALGVVSDNLDDHTLGNKVERVFKVGDAVKPAGVKEAIESGFKIACTI